ncbi:hypothetical protein Back11_07260 [Paenibacillus baekrokdamisoli]|uniref:Uncharacterized protein n=1 Tax=Paenibacillus baekrokdamisoli TaxID=1712516 RepID=A0A3G9J0G5_9BACL|nr:DNA invertase Pin-like site-specific DNA recombinase [Paenibacillus baekrokdamisoli]BBH19381.1 hypothetical protein Back11_07260 [Paenibacillus baekrokdamisoli]
MESKTIKHVAVYLRKSRDDGEFEDVLSKHRDTLLALVENRNWTYRLYEEVASGEKIESRKEMQKLLRHVEDQLYDGVVVMDIDRLGRGENKDWALIKDTFLNSETVIITPNKIYDLEIDNDDVSFDFMSIFARIEYKTIKRRMKQGKEAGAKKGMWTNGKPPFPYYYDKNTRSVLVDETKLPIYRAIVEKYLNGTNLGHIAIWLTITRYPRHTTLSLMERTRAGQILRFNGCWQAKSIWVTSLMVKPVPNVDRWNWFPKKSGLKSWEHMKS